MQLQPYLHFNGRCDEAIQFYKKALGAEVNMLMRFKDCPDKNAPIKPEVFDKVMHANLNIGGNTLLISDGQCQGTARFDGFSLTLNVKNDSDAKRLFDALQDGGKIVMPLGKTFFSSSFGMVNDRFGVSWMVIVQ